MIYYGKKLSHVYKMKKIEKNISLDKMIFDSLEGHSSDSSTEADDDSFSDSLNTKLGDAAKNDEQKSLKEKDVAVREEKTNLEKMKEAIDSEFSEDTVITIANLREKSQMESAIKGKWASKLMAEKVRGIRLRKKLELLCSGLEKMYSESRTTPSSYLNSRRATDSMLNENKDVRSLRIAVEDNKLIVEYLERLWVAIQGFGYTIRNSIESAKLEMGI